MVSDGARFVTAKVIYMARQLRVGRLGMAEGVLLDAPHRNKERRARSKHNRELTADTGAFFENEVWLLLDRMRFDDLNPQGFRLDVTPKGYAPQQMQVDVLGQWQKEVLVIECKAAEGVRDGLDRGDLADLHDKMPRIVDALQEMYGKDIQVHFIFWVKNISPRQRDVDDCNRYGVTVLDYDDYREFFQTAKTIGPASRFQLLANLYEQRTLGPRWRSRVPAISGKVGGYRFYLFMIDPRKLLPLASVARRRPSELGEASTKMGGAMLYQRMLVPKKLREVSKYISSGGFFPNNLVVSFRRSANPKTLEDLKASGLKLVMLSLPPSYGSVTIIDGQHRLFGYSDIEEEGGLIPVMAFEDLDPNEQGRLFVDINSKQKKVDSNLLWDLHEYFGGSYKGALSRVVKELNRRPFSPLAGRVLVPSETRKAGLPLKMTALCTAIDFAGVLPLLCDKRDNFTEGDIEFCTAVLASYFTAIREFNDSTRADWGEGRSGYLSSNNGISTLIFFLEALLRTAKVLRLHERHSEILRDAKPDALSAQISKLAGPAIAHLSALSQDEKTAYRRSSSKGQQLAFAGELELKAQEREPAFVVVHSKTEAAMSASAFDHLMEDFIVMVLSQHLGSAWYVQGVHPEYRQRIESVARRRGRDPSAMSPQELMRYADLGTLGQIIMNKFSFFADILHVHPSVFDSHLGAMNAYRGGRAPIHTGETEKYTSLMGRAAIGMYGKIMEKYVTLALARLTTTSNAKPSNEGNNATAKTA